jgi:CheY-like chemotaxis protein
MLESLGCRVLLANNGLEGFEMYKKHCQQLDFVLMDCEMPVMDGFDCTRNIRQYETDTQLKPICIVALTAHALPVNKELCLKSGMDSVLTKPIKFNHLEQALAELKLD